MSKNRDVPHVSTIVVPVSIDQGNSTKQLECTMRFGQTDDDIFIEISSEEDLSFLYLHSCFRADFAVLKSKNGITLEFKDFSSAFERTLGNCAKCEVGGPFVRFSLVENGSKGTLYICQPCEDGFMVANILVIDFVNSSDHKKIEYLSQKVRSIRSELEIERNQKSNVSYELDQTKRELEEKITEIADLKALMRGEQEAVELKITSVLNEERIKHSELMNSLKESHVKIHQESQIKFTNDLHQLQIKLDEQQRKVVELMEKLGSGKNQMQNVEEMKKKTDEKLKELQKANKTLKDQLNEEVRTLESRNQQLEASEATVAQLNVQLKATEAGKDEFEKIVTEVREKCENERKKFDEANERIRNLKNLTEDISNQRSKLLARVQKLTSDRTALKAELKQTSTVVQHQEQLLENSNERIDEGRQYKQRFEIADGQLKALEMRMRELETELKRYSHESNEKQETINYLHSQLSVHMRELEYVGSSTHSFHPPKLASGSLNTLNSNTLRTSPRIQSQQHHHQQQFSDHKEDNSADNIISQFRTSFFNISRKNSNPAQQSNEEVIRPYGGTMSSFTADRQQEEEQEQQNNSNTHHTNSMTNKPLPSPPPRMPSSRLTKSPKQAEPSATTSSSASPSSFSAATTSRTSVPLMATVSTTIDAKTGSKMMRFPPQQPEHSPSPNNHSRNMIHQYKTSTTTTKMTEDSSMTAANRLRRRISSLTPVNIASTIHKY